MKSGEVVACTMRSDHYLIKGFHIINNYIDIHVLIQTQTGARVDYINAQNDTVDTRHHVRTNFSRGYPNDVGFNDRVGDGN